jgi:hypothetical protein
MIISIYWYNPKNKYTLLSGNKDREETAGENAQRNQTRHHTYCISPNIYARLFVLRHLVREPLSSPTRDEGNSSQPPSSIMSRKTSPDGDTYGTYSPSLFPTISSVIRISWYVFPLCTENRRPTKFGRIVAARFCVLIGGVPGGGGSVRGRGRLDSQTRCQSLCFNIVSFDFQRPVFQDWMGIRLFGVSNVRYDVRAWMGNVSLSSLHENRKAHNRI